jgi:hypothetical protein
MNENITTIILLDKTETLGRIKPLYCTFFHCETPFNYALAEPLNKKYPICSNGPAAWNPDFA